MVGKGNYASMVLSVSSLAADIYDTHYIYSKSTIRYQAIHLNRMSQIDSQTWYLSTWSHNLNTTIIHVNLANNTFYDCLQGYVDAA